MVSRLPGERLTLSVEALREIDKELGWLKDENARLCQALTVPDRTLTLVVGRGLIGHLSEAAWLRLLQGLREQVLTRLREARSFSADSDSNPAAPVRIVLECDP